MLEDTMLCYVKKGYMPLRVVAEPYADKQETLGFGWGASDILALGVFL